MRRALRHPAVVLPIAAVVVAVAVAGWLWVQLHARWAQWEGDGVTVDLPTGLDAGTMLERLHRAGVLRYPRVSRLWLSASGGGGDLKAGEYRFEEPLSPLQVLDKLARGAVLLHPVTLPEGLDRQEIAGRLAEAGFGDTDHFERVFASVEALEGIDAEADDLEGYLFPDTYHWPRGEAPEAIARALVGRFNEITGADYAARAAAVGLSLREAVVLASLIEKETSVPGERRRISRVFHNRLARGMKLQCDPTVMYALRREGRPVERLRYADLEFDSPWNTYRVYGLPPGPICNPGHASLEAAVDPVDGDELYFVASPAGGHAFSSDLQGHQEAVRQWRRHQRSSR